MPPGLSDTKNLYNAVEGSKTEAWDGKQPEFGKNLYEARKGTFLGVNQTTSMMGVGSQGKPTVLMQGTQQLDHNPSWKVRIKAIYDYGNNMTQRAMTDQLTEDDNRLIASGYYMRKGDKYVATTYCARMYYNDYDSLTPSTGSANASAGSSAITHAHETQLTLGQVALAERFLRQVHDNLGLWTGRLMNYPIEEGEIFSENIEALYNEFDKENRLELAYIKTNYTKL